MSWTRRCSRAPTWFAGAAGLGLVVVGLGAVSFLAALVLYRFAIGEVQGFAYALGLTTLIDAGVVFGFTKPAITLLAGTKFFGGGHRWSGLDPARLVASEKTIKQLVHTRSHHQ
jgi:hypothetical protein